MRRLIVALRLVLLLLVSGAVVVGFVLASRRDAAREVGAYACPMHPEVTSASPGTCPICGMALTSIAATDSSSSGPGSAPEAAVLSVARRRLINEQVRAPAWVDADGIVNALLYNEDLAALAPDERGSFFSAAAPKAARRIIRRPEAPRAWDGSTSVARFGSSDDTQHVDPGDVGRILLAPRPREVLLVPAAAVLQSPEGRKISSCKCRNLAGVTARDGSKSTYSKTQPVLDASGPISTVASGGSFERISAMRWTNAFRPGPRSDADEKTTSTYPMPDIDEPRTAVTLGKPSRALVMRLVTSEATSAAGCPIQSTTTPICGSERSGTASRRSRVRAKPPAIATRSAMPRTSHGWRAL